MAPNVDAAAIARRQNAGGNVASLMDHRAPPCLRNHARDNILAMRKKEAQNRGKMALENCKPPQPVFKLKQFDNIQSRLNDLPRPLGRNRSCPPQAPPKVAAHAPASARNQGCEEHVMGLVGVSPCNQEQGDSKQAKEQEKDGKAEEMDLASFEAEVERLKRAHGTKPAPRQFQKDAGGRPAYLQKIKANLAEEQQRQIDEKNKPKIPPGYRQMPDDERVQTLEALQKKREELEKVFQNLPLKIETDGQKRRQKTVLEKIKETDAGIATFSQQSVLVQM